MLFYFCNYKISKEFRVIILKRSDIGIYNSNMKITAVKILKRLF